IAIGIDIGRDNLPLLSFHRVGVEYSPDGPSGVIRWFRVLVHRHGGVEKVVLGGIVFDILVIAVVVGRVGFDFVVHIAVGVIPFGLIEQSFATVIDRDKTLPVLHVQAGGADQGENRGFKLPGHIIVLRGERALSANVITVFKNLVRKSP